METSKGTKGSAWTPPRLGVWSSDSCVQLGINTIPPLSLKRLCLYCQRQGISRPRIKGLFCTDSMPDNFLQARPNKRARSNFWKVLAEVRSCYIQSSAVCSITSCCFLPCLAAALPVSLSLSHCPLRLLGGVKKEPTGDLRSIMQVCSYAVCWRLFAPHIAFSPIGTHAESSCTTSCPQRKVNSGSLCVSCARCEAKRCLTSPAPPRRPHRHVWERKEKWLCDPGIHYKLCGRCCCLRFVCLCFAQMNGV